MTPAELRVGDRSVHRQGPGLPQVRRHEPLRRADVHRLLGRGAEDDRRARARARQMAETHATSPEGLRSRSRPASTASSIRKSSTAKELDADLVKRITDKQLVCSMLVNTITGEAWTQAPEGSRRGGEEASRSRQEGAPRAPATSFEDRKRASDLGLDLEMRRRNAQALIRAGALVTVGTDNYWAAAASSRERRNPKTRITASGPSSASKASSSSA